MKDWEVNGSAQRSTKIHEGYECRYNSVVPELSLFIARPQDGRRIDDLDADRLHRTIVVILEKAQARECAVDDLTQRLTVR